MACSKKTMCLAFFLIQHKNGWQMASKESNILQMVPFVPLDMGIQSYYLSSLVP